MRNAPSVDISIVVIARNEAARLDGCVASILDDLPTAAAAVTVLLNDCRDASAAIIRRLAGVARVPLRGYGIAFADKSNAWNQYLHGPAGLDAGLHVFVDGYAHVRPGSLKALADALAGRPGLNAATGVPSEGRSAAQQRETLVRSGGLHGSLHALPDAFVGRLRARGLHLPTGLYRGDGLIGSFAMYDLDPLSRRWDPARVAVVTEATWSIPPYRISDLRRHWVRRINQARGRMEGRAIRRIIEAEGYEALPRNADLMLRDDLAAHADARPGRFDLFGRLALARLATPRVPEERDLLARPLATPSPTDPMLA